MIRKKSSFLTFCFSFLPGAGQMYMGFMRRGVSLMASFFLLIFFTMWIRFSPLMLALPIIWFYAFFDTFNLRAMPDDEFYAMEDEYILFPDVLKGKSSLFQEKSRKILAVILIFIGITILWHNCTDILEHILPQAIRSAMNSFGYYFPQMLVAVGIVALGVYLINGKKRELDSADQVPQIEDKGGDR